MARAKFLRSFTFCEESLPYLSQKFEPRVASASPARCKSLLDDRFGGCVGAFTGPIDTRV
jgi:hypothetical protein